MHSPTPAPAPPDIPTAERRDFLKKFLALLTGGIATLVPSLGALVMFLDPLKSRSAASTNAIRVGSLSALPADGFPRKFPVVASRTDVWNRLPPAPIGAVYLRRTGPTAVQAFNVICPHAGCFVEYLSDKKEYLCPCHNSTFTLTGARGQASSPSPRDLDELKVEIRNGDEIWVEFRNFLTGHADKVVQS
jgi:Rieske Fe-S protein